MAHLAKPLAPILIKYRTTPTERLKLSNLLEHTQHKSGSEEKIPGISPQRGTVFFPSLDYAVNKNTRVRGGKTLLIPACDWPDN